MKGGPLRNRVGVGAAGADEVGRETDLALGQIFARGIAWLDAHFDRNRTERSHFVGVELRRWDVVRARIGLRAVFVDVIEMDEVLHGDSAFNLMQLAVISPPSSGSPPAPHPPPPCRPHPPVAHSPAHQSTDPGPSPTDRRAAPPP